MEELCSQDSLQGAREVHKGTLNSLFYQCNPAQNGAHKTSYKMLSLAVQKTALLKDVNSALQPLAGAVSQKCLHPICEVEKQHVVLSSYHEQPRAGQEPNLLPSLHLPFNLTQQALSHPPKFWYLPDNTRTSSANI